eukprot:scaffold210878_cov32-Tisochrysis_lutea.AAC.1
MKAPPRNAYTKEAAQQHSKLAPVRGVGFRGATPAAATASKRPAAAAPVAAAPAVAAVMAAFGAAAAAADAMERGPGLDVSAPQGRANSAAWEAYRAHHYW